MRPLSSHAVATAAVVSTLLIGCKPEPTGDFAVDGAIDRIDAAISEGETVPNRTITVSNHGNSTLLVSISDAESSGGNWLGHTPNSLTIPKNQSATFTVTFPGASALYAGTYTGTITLAGLSQPSGTPSTPSTILIPVNLTVRRAVAGLSTDTSSVAVDSLFPDTWRATSSGAEARRFPTMVWTSYEVLVAGGTATDGSPVDSAWLYEPLGDEWRHATDLEGGLVGASATYHDGLVYLYGGYGVGGPTTANDTLTVYEPILDTVLAVESYDEPRFSHAAVATNDRIWVWGGSVLSGNAWNPTNTGFSYAPSTNTFVAMNTTGAPSARENATLVSVPGGLIVWGGSGCQADGARYDVAGGTWTPIAAAPTGIDGPGVWTGKELVVWGGCSGPTQFGAAYDPGRERWRLLPGFAAPAARYGHSFVWTGAEAIVFGGRCVGVMCQGGGAYDPLSDAWRAIVGDEPAAPGARADHGAVWTGNELVVWGGVNDTPTLLGTGAAYFEAP